jgi:hypothetical protein
LVSDLEAAQASVSRITLNRQVQSASGKKIQKLGKGGASMMHEWIMRPSHAGTKDKKSNPNSNRAT